MKNYVAVIGDLKNSKSIEDRRIVQEKLNKVLEEINSDYNEFLSAKFIITLGDEFQGLLSDGSSVMKILSRIERQMYPVMLRFGIGVGGITTAINPAMSIGADGPGFYCARTAIVSLKENENKKQIFSGDIRVEFEEDKKEIKDLINVVFNLMASLKSGWSDRQREIIWRTLENNDTQAEIAENFGITQPTVNRILATGKYYAYKDAFDSLDKAFSEIRG